MADVAKVFDLYLQAQLWHLEGWQEWRGISLDDKAKAYNGIGADWMPQSVVDKLTEWLAVFEPAALLHDLGFKYAEDRSRESFRKTNLRFLRNCVRCLFCAFGLGSGFWSGLPKAWALYAAVRDFGWKAWEDAHQ